MASVDEETRKDRKKKINKRNRKNTKGTMNELLKPHATTNNEEGQGVFVCRQPGSEGEGARE